MTDILLLCVILSIRFYHPNALQFLFLHFFPSNLSLDFIQATLSMEFIVVSLNFCTKIINGAAKVSSSSIYLLKFILITRKMCLYHFGISFLYIRVYLHIQWPYLLYSLIHCICICAIIIIVIVNNYFLHPFLSIAMSLTIKISDFNVVCVCSFFLHSFFSPDNNMFLKMPEQPCEWHFDRSKKRYNFIWKVGSPTDNCNTNLK